jgi:hypothetical protein
VAFWDKKLNKKYFELVNKQKIQQKQLNNSPATVYRQYKASSHSIALLTQRKKYGD